MPTYVDQCGRTVEMEGIPNRIVSTVPSQTELLHDLGLNEAIVGVTAYCVHPKSLMESKTVIGGTKDLKLEQIRALKPDLIIANKEENIKEQIEELAKEFPVWISDVETFEQGLSMIKDIGKLTGKVAEANEMVDQISSLKQSVALANSLRTLYFIWKEPYMLSGNSTYISNMLDHLGLENIAPSNSQRYPQIAYDALKEYDPELILLTSEPYSFKAADAHELGELFPNALIKIVDGEMFTWYGSRMILAMRYFQKLASELSLRFSK